MESLSNVTFDEIRVGDTANVPRKLSGFEVTSRADNVRTRLVSAAVMKLAVQAERTATMTKGPDL